ncbi:glutathione S-transferase family protein [Pararhizobium haloflavum]|uniref:glutathione S-transferase family protein n=1 Tax=Pararhizobium haloflavum TaxID=2037914 RepID=UPI000C18C350|nr:glutathione S-transferase family protein [Pararhizobium haloflavum]
MTITLYELVGKDETRPFSPHCWKVAMALAHKGLDWTSVKTPFTGITGIEGAGKTVPVIRDGERIVSDSFQIALYLEKTHPDRPALFGGPGGEAMARFVESWTQTQLNAVLGMAAVMDIHDCLSPTDQTYFRKSREARFGATLSEAKERGVEKLPELRGRLQPLRAMFAHQPYIGGQTPLFADYIVFGSLQWIRIVSPDPLLERDDPVLDWFDRCLDLHDGLGRKTPAAA